MSYYHIKVRRDTAANWAANNPTPASGEVCLETDTKKFKFGDGVTAYSSLSYFTLPAATTSIPGLMSAADKTKLNGINMALYALLASPSFTGTPTAPSITNHEISNTIATMHALEQAISRVLPYTIRCEYSVLSDGSYQVITSDGIDYVKHMSVNGLAVPISENQELSAGNNYVDFVLDNGGLLCHGTIPEQCFANITNLYNAHLSSQVHNIGNNAFFDCSELIHIWVESMTPPALGTSVFAGTKLALGEKAYVHDAAIADFTADWTFGCAFDSINT